jgi:hypothetical protein
LAVSTQEVASSARAADGAEPCRRCGAPLADDQRYCLQCGERRVPVRSALLSGPPASPPPSAPPFPPGTAPTEGPARGGAVTVLAGVGVLLLAMGVGVLIGRSGASSSSAGPPAVVTVGTAPSVGSSAGAGSASEVTDDWPSGKSGFTVLLQTLPQASTTPSAVAQAKSAASAKGAPSVGALKTGDFASLTAGSYDIYSGEYTTRAQAEKALASLRRSFPGASVIKVSGAATRSGSSGEAGASGGGSGGASGGGSGSTGTLQKLSKSRGKNYEQESKNLPNEVGT